MAAMPEITINVSDTVYELLGVLTGDAKQTIETLIDHAQQGVYRPGAWEREWLLQVFFGDEWLPRLEPGDPYGRDDSPMFQKPRAFFRNVKGSKWSV